MPPGGCAAAGGRRRRMFMLILALVCVTGSEAVGQVGQTATLVGQVIDGETGLPLVGVNVYLSGTTLGSVTNSEGEFKIEGIPPASYTVVASIVGYVRQTSNVQAGGAPMDALTFRLKPQIVELGAISVEGRPPRDWKRMLRQFKERFLGQGPNADACKILNPEVLDLAYSSRDDRLSARAQRPLRVDNGALGYHLTIDLDTMIASDSRWEYRALVRYEEMEPGTAKQADRWMRRRREAYAGSPGHFLSALIKGKLLTEGFRMHAVAQPGDGWETEQDPTQLEGLVQPGPTEFVYVIRGPIVLWIVYGDNGVVQTDRSVYRERRTNDLRWDAQRRPRHPGSWLNVTRAFVHVNPSGWMYEQEGLLRYGEWASRRMADELPMDYQVDTKK